MRIRMTKEGKKTRLFKGHHLPEICLLIAGGGNTPDQTANAMALMSELETHKTATVKGVLIELIDD